MAKKSKSDEEEKKVGRGRDTMFRVVYSNQISLTQMADTKANIIIGITTMIISSVVAISGYGLLSGFMESSGNRFILPVVMIVLTSLGSVVFAVQATRPKFVNLIDNPGATGRSSLFFFGIIASFTQEEYLKEVDKVFDSRETVYRHMAIDVHNQGVILRRKYNLLSYPYQIFLYGFVACVLTFLALLLVG
ncbi:MAG: Pycsar system effector family protein [Bacteroidota bacterium]